MNDQELSEAITDIEETLRLCNKVDDEIIEKIVQDHKTWGKVFITLHITVLAVLLYINH